MIRSDCGSRPARKEEDVMVVALPRLYSFRRCPYAMRARLGILFAGLQVELREVVLKNKPAQMLAISPKGTVPVLEWAAGEGSSGQVIEESREIVEWRSEEHTSELQSRGNLVCRLLLEKKKRQAGGF